MHRLKQIPFFSFGLMIVFCLFVDHTHAQSFNQLRSDTANLPVGSIHQYRLLYDCHNCYPSSSDAITVSYLVDRKKNRLFRQSLDGFYVSEVTVLRIQSDYFVYINSGHTYGHEQGFLFYVNEKTMRAYPVKVAMAKYKLRKGEYVHKYFDLQRKPGNRFVFSATIRSDKAEDESYEEGSYQLVRRGPNRFELIGKLK
jgi:hypothetical protein